MAQQPGLTIQEMAAREHGWRLADVRVGEVKALRHGGCAVYRASDPTRLDQQPAEYAVLPGGEVARGATEVLRRCGQGASAQWWAQVITRLGGARGILVDEHAPSALRKLRAAGAKGSAPQLEVTAHGTSVTFYTVDYEGGGVSRVQAVLPDQGELVVRQAEVMPGQRGQ